MEVCLKSKPCTCGGTMREVINVIEGPRTRSGWFCPDCKAWEKAILRERIVTADHLVKGNV